MASGWRYRIFGAVGTLLITGTAVTVANHPAIQALLTSQIPIIRNLSGFSLSNGRLLLVYLTTSVVVFLAITPLLKPRPRRILDTLLETQWRVVIALLGLATIGYFDYSYRLPRPTLIAFGAILLIGLPIWFVLIRRNPSAETPAIIVGDDPEAMADLFEASDTDLLGYVSPPLPSAKRIHDGGAVVAADTEEHLFTDQLPRLGGLAKLDDVLVENDIETAFLGFSTADREDFFGALDECHENGISAKVHRDHVDNVLTDSGGAGKIVDVELEPLDSQDYVLKRLFDITFSAIALLITAPVSMLIAIAIKLDDWGPIFYQQQRTAEFGRSFSVYKFRTMASEGESATPVSDDENDRITRVGRFLRATHLDEIPQLVAILTGKMSVVGPRAVWREEEIILQEETDRWRRRWFVRPGLTGLAQIRSVTSEDPEEKLRLDLEYIRRQSFWFDVKIVMRQLWMVFVDMIRVIWMSLEDNRDRDDN